MSFHFCSMTRTSTKPWLLAESLTLKVVSIRLTLKLKGKLTEHCRHAAKWDHRQYARFSGFLNVLSGGRSSN